MVKRKLKITLIIIGVLIFLLGVWLFLYLKEVSYQLKEGARIARAAFDPTTEIGKANLERRSLIYKQGTYENKGYEYMKEEKYDEAIEQFKKALQFGGLVWANHEALSEAYEIADRYREALTELNWLISKNPRQEVLDELIARRNSVGAALQGKFSAAASYAKAAYELQLENARQFYLMGCASWPKDKALKHVDEEVAVREDIKRYYNHWKYLESLSKDDPRNSTK